MRERANRISQLRDANLRFNRSAIVNGSLGANIGPNQGEALREKSVVSEASGQNPSAKGDSDADVKRPSSLRQSGARASESRQAASGSSANRGAVWSRPK